MSATPMTFNQGETLTAKKMTELGARVASNGVNGVVQKSRNGNTIGLQDGRNYIEPLRPFDVERATDESIFVRGGSFEYFVGITRKIVGLTCDDGVSSDPFEYKTLAPTLVADTEYTVYTELDTTANTLTAAVIATASFPANDITLFRRTLTTFTTTADATIPSFDPVSSEQGPQVVEPYPFEVVDDGLVVFEDYFRVRGGTVTVVQPDGTATVVPLDDQNGGTISYPSELTDVDFYFGDLSLWLDLNPTNANPALWTLDFQFGTTKTAPTTVTPGHIYKLLAINTDQGYGSTEQIWTGGSFEIYYIQASDATPEDVTNTGSAGTSVKLSRADHVHASSGFSGSWVNNDGNTVTVVKGLITTVAP